MTTWAEYKTNALKDPELKREYDALEGWYREELAKQEALDHTETEKRSPHTNIAAIPSLCLMIR